MTYILQLLFSIKNYYFYVAEAIVYQTSAIYPQKNRILLVWTFGGDWQRLFLEGL